jgi:hypothetical protein
MLTKSVPMGPVLSQLNSFYILTTYFLKTHFSIILLFVPIQDDLEFYYSTKGGYWRSFGAENVN